MSDQAYSRPNDLMVGAGTLYFKRTQSKDEHGFHHLGNCTSFTLSTEINKIEKNSSMNRHRELMQSIVTSVKASAKITLEEYNPYNLALGLFGEESFRKQAAKQLVDEVYTVQSVPGIISLVDADGNKYMNVKDIVVKPVSAIPATFTGKGVTADMTLSTTSVTNDTLTDTKGGKLELKVGTFAGTSDVRVFITVTSAPNANGNLDGLKLEVKEGISGAPQTFTAVSGTTETFTLTSGAQIEASVGALASFTVNTAMNEALLTASISAFKVGRDYAIEDVESRAGFIKIARDGLIKQGDKVKISAKIPEETFIEVAGATAGTIEGELLFTGDPNSGAQYVLEGWRCKVTPDGDLSGLITDNDFGNFTLNVDFVSDRENHPDHPLYKLTRVGEASADDKGAGYYDPKY